GAEDAILNSRELVPGDRAHFCDHAGAGNGVALDYFGPEKSESIYTAEIWHRIGLIGTWFSGDGRRSGVCRARTKSVAGVAGNDLLGSYVRRVMRESGGIEFGDEAGAETVRRPDDGSLVPGNFAGKCNCGKDRWRIRSECSWPDAGTLPANGHSACRCRCCNDRTDPANK